MLHRLRKTLTFADGICQIAAAIGWVETGEAAGKSEAMARKWGDDNHDVVPNLRQAMLIDARYVNETGNPPILMQIFQVRLAQMTNDAPLPVLGTPEEEIQDIPGPVGKLFEYMRSTKSPRNERQCRDIEHIAEEAKEQITELVTSVQIEVSGNRTAAE